MKNSLYFVFALGVVLAGCDRDPKAIRVFGKFPDTIYSKFIIRHI